MESNVSSAGTRASSTTPTRSSPVSAIARVRSAKRIRGSTGRGAHTSVYATRAASRAGRARMTSPIAPGRIRSLRLTRDTYRQRDVDGFRRQAHAVVARLIAKLAGDVDQSRLHRRRHLKTCDQLEAS